MPTFLITFNMINRGLSAPHTTPLWAYFITPLVTALPFLASLVGLSNARNEWKGEQGVAPYDR